MKRRNATALFFASPRYYTDPRELSRLYEEAAASLPLVLDGALLVTSESELAAVSGGGLLVAIPMSGAVQSLVLAAAEKFDAVCLCAGYVDGNLPRAVSSRLLELNAAPAVMDTYAVLRRGERPALLCDSPEALESSVRAVSAYLGLRGARLLLIGAVEPWVVSASRDLSLYKSRFGVEIEQIPLDTLERYFRESDLGEAQAIAERYRRGAECVLEPSEDDLLSAARVCLAVSRLLDEHSADGAAIACFDMLSRLHTTACLTVSLLTSETDRVVACEGDLDSAVSMLLLRRLSDGGVWMANPNLLGDGRVNFVHCTAPIALAGKPCGYRLRSHHESGIGVSPEVDFPPSETVTACRLSAATGKMTVHLGKGRQGVGQPSCRTQYEVSFRDYPAYLENALGCHQVFAFCDLSSELRLVGRLLGLEVVSS